MAYEYFCQFYDYLMSDVDYLEYVNIVKEYANKDDTILEIGCGTGNVLIELLKNGYNISGLDISDEMLLICQEKLSKWNLFTKLYQDDMRDIHVIDSYNIIISFLDSINYLTTLEDIKKTFFNINRALKYNGYFIFDVHSLDNVNIVFEDYCYNEVKEDYAFLWNAYIEKNDNFTYIYHDLTFFLKTENDQYQKLSEEHKQLVLQIIGYMKLLEENNFVIEKVFKNKYNKIIIIAKKCST